MNKSRWKDTAEIVGIAAIFASLVFVGLELRQSNQLARLAALESMASEWNSVNIQFASDDVIAELLAKVTNEGAVPSDFSSSDNSRLQNIFSGLDHHWELRLKQLELGVLKPDDYSIPRVGNPLFDSDYHRAIWPEYRRGFSDEFAKFWEERFKLVPN